MTAIRSVDSLKYGVRLFGSLLTVLAVGGGLLALGLELGYSEATDLAGAGTLSTISTTDLAAGGVLSFLGSFVLLTGLIGVVHKLVADSVAVGIEAGTPASEPVVTEREPEPEATESETETEARSTDADAPAATASGADAAPETPAPEPTTADQSGETEQQEPSLAEMFEESDGAEQVRSSASSGPENGDSVQAPPHRVDPSSTPSGDHESQAPPDEQPADTETTDERRDPPREPTPEEIAFGTASTNDADDADEMPAADESEGTTQGDDLSSSESTKSVGNSSGTDPLADPGDE
jgi:hypothetical protein